MTTGAQRTRALINVGDFLEELAASQSMLDIERLRQHAQHLLRHYPSNTEIAWIAKDLAQSPSAAMGQMLDPLAVPQEMQKGYRRW